MEADQGLIARVLENEAKRLKGCKSLEAIEARHAAWKSKQEKIRIRSRVRAGILTFLRAEKIQSGEKKS